MGLTSNDHVGVYQFLADLESGIERTAPGGISSGSFGHGGGGPTFLDNARSRRPPLPGELIDAYKAVAYSCVNLNANAVARVPLRLYCRTGRDQNATRFWSRRRLNTTQRDRLIERMYSSAVTRGFASGDDTIEEIVDCGHPLLATLARPNEHFDGNLFIQFIARSLDVLGVCYVYPERVAPNFAPSELWPLTSQHCFPVKGTGGKLIDGYQYFGELFGAGEMIRIRFPSLRDPYLSGFGPLHACYEQLDLVGYYTATVAAILTGGARPEMMVGPKEADKPWTPVQKKRMEAEVNGRFGGGRAGRIWFVDGSFDAKPLSYPPADLGGQIISREARLIAANCFDVPISMLETESSNKATASEGSIQHQRNAVEPRCSLIAAALTHQVAHPINDRLFFMFDSPVQNDRKADADIHAIYLDRQVLVPGEVRTELGYERRPGDDRPLNQAAAQKPGAQPEESDE